MNEPTLHQLIRRCIEDTATPAELEALHALVADQEGEEAFQQLWEKIQQMPIAQGDVPEADIDRHVTQIWAELAQHAQATKGTKEKSASSRPWRWIPVAASVVILLSAAIFILLAKRERVLTEVEAPAPIEYSGLQYITLPDGSRVTLNDNSTLSYQPNFGDAVREVTLTGEAYFDIAHDASRPFIVRAGDITTTVLGTAFNIQAYAESDAVVVTVERGKVKVTPTQKTNHPQPSSTAPHKDNSNQGVADTHTPEILTAHEQLTIHKHTHHTERTHTEDLAALNWKQGFFILDNVTVRQAAEQLETHYNINITITNPAILDCEMRLAFLHQEDVDHVLSWFTKMLDAKYEMRGDEVVISEGTPCIE